MKLEESVVLSGIIDLVEYFVLVLIKLTPLNLIKQRLLLYLLPKRITGDRSAARSTHGPISTATEWENLSDGLT